MDGLPSFVALDVAAVRALSFDVVHAKLSLPPRKTVATSNYRRRRSFGRCSYMWGRVEAKLELARLQCCDGKYI